MKVQLFFVLILCLHNAKCHVINLPLQQLGLTPIDSQPTPLLLRSQPSEEHKLDTSSYRVHVLPLLIQRDEKTGQHILLSNGQSFIMNPNNFFVEVLPAFSNDLRLIANQPLIPVDPNIQSTNANVVHVGPVKTDHVLVSNTNNETPVVVPQNESGLEIANEVTPVVLRPGLTAPFISRNIPQFFLPGNYPPYRADHNIPLVAAPKTVSSHDTSHKDKVVPHNLNNILLKFVDNKPTAKISEESFIVPLVEEVIAPQNAGNFAYHTEQIHGYAEPIYYGNMARKVSNDKVFSGNEDHPPVKEPEVIRKTAYETTHASEQPPVVHHHAEENHNCTTEANSHNDAVVIEAAHSHHEGEVHKPENVAEVHAEEHKTTNETK